MARGDYLARTQGGTTNTTNTTNTKGGGGSKGSIDLGGLFSSIGSIFGGNKQAKIAEENRRFQEEQNTLAYERSLPYSSQGPSGNVEFDNETKQIISTLSPEYQQMMEGWLGTSGMANAELQGMMGDPYAMEQQQMARFDAMNARGDDRARAAQQEQALATGRMGGTQGYYDQLAVSDAINQRRLGESTQAMGQGMAYRQMLGQESQGFGANAMNVAGMLTSQADLGSMVGARTKPGVNIEGLSAAGTNYADTKSGFWSGMQGQAAEYNSAGKLTAEATNGWLDPAMKYASSMFTGKGSNI